MLFDCIVTILLSYVCPSSDPFVDIGSAVALLKSSNSNSNSNQHRRNKSTSNLYSLSSENTINVVESNLNVESFRTLRGGTYIFTTDARRYWVTYSGDESLESSTEEIAI